MESIADIGNIPSPRIIRKDMSLASGFNSEVDEAFKDYKTAVSETVKSNLELLEEIPLPKSLSLGDLKEFFQKDIPSDLSNDATFEKAVEVGKYARDIAKYMSSYFREIFVFHNTLKKEMYGSLFQVSRMFLNSDLPIPFLRSVERSILAHIDYIDIFDREIHREHRDLIVNRNDKRKFDRICTIHNEWVKAFGEKTKSLERKRVRLLWYVDFNNSTSLDEIFKDKFIELRSLDRGVLQEFVESLRQDASDLETLNLSRATFEPFSASEYNDGARAIMALMKLIAR
jgi:hypothetical protein